MRRKKGELLVLEQQILKVIEEDELHGFAIALRMRDQHDGKNLAAHGTLYRALARLEDMGHLTSRWEDQDIADQAYRPRRRLYRRRVTNQSLAEVIHC